MLADRFYMRKPEFGPRRSAMVTVLIINVVAFLALGIFERLSSFPLGAYLQLSLEDLRRGFIWQLFTFQICHANFLHLAFNCLAIFMFGRDVEDRLGRNTFFALYFISGVVGGLAQTLAGIVFGGIFAAPVVGASAGAFGLTAAYSVLFPDRILLLFFIIPLKARYLLLLSIALAVWGIAFPSDNVAHAAHLGGILGGFIMVRYAVHWNISWPRLGGRKKQPSRPLVKVHSYGTGWGTSQGAAEDSGSTDFLSKEVDPILEKISAHGIQSLTDKERNILDKARARMGKSR
jgi:membrane associated rhomboid family serine protease